MPNRILKESVNESKSLAAASPFAQDLFKRLITYADDYGRFNADPEIMRARLYPRELDAVTLSDLEDSLVELAGVGNLKFYTSHVEPEKVFGHFPKWSEHQRVRNTRAKCPDPEDGWVNDWYLRRFIPIDLKVTVFERDRFTCQECGRSFSLDGVPIKQAIRVLNGALHIDHIVPVNQGGRATLENLRLLCAGCNLKRPRVFSPEELAHAATCGSPPQSAATGGGLRPESNPNPNPNPNPDDDDAREGQTGEETPEPDPAAEDRQAVIAYIQRHHPTWDGDWRTRQELGIFAEELGGQGWLLILEALKRTDENRPGNPWKYVQGVLKCWREEGIRTLDQLQIADEQRKARSSAQGGRSRGHPSAPPPQYDDLSGYLKSLRSQGGTEPDDDSNDARQGPAP